MIPEKIREKYKSILEKSVDKWGDECDKDLEIDKYNLDEMVATQAQLYYKWARRSAKARKFKKLMEARYEKLKAIEELNVRKTPDKYGVVADSKGKIMEGAIKATVTKNNTVIKARNDFFMAYELRLTLLDAANSFAQRVSMIREEVKLWANEYYSDELIGGETESYREGMKRRKNR